MFKSPFTWWGRLLPSILAALEELERLLALSKEVQVLERRRQRVAAVLNPADLYVWLSKPLAVAEFERISVLARVVAYAELEVRRRVLARAYESLKFLFRYYPEFWEGLHTSFVPAIHEPSPGLMLARQFIEQMEQALASLGQESWQSERWARWRLSEYNRANTWAFRPDYSGRGRY